MQPKHTIFSICLFFFLLFNMVFISWLSDGFTVLQWVFFFRYKPVFLSSTTVTFSGFQFYHFLHKQLLLPPPISVTTMATDHTIWLAIPYLISPRKCCPISSFTDPHVLFFSLAHLGVKACLTTISIIVCLSKLKVLSWFQIRSHIWVSINENTYSYSKWHFFIDLRVVSLLGDNYGWL